MNRKRLKVLGYIGLIIGFLVLLFFAVGPYFRMFIASFMTVEDFFALPMRYLPTEWSTRNFKSIFADPAFSNSLLNSFRSSLVATAITMVLSIPAGYSLASRRFPGRRKMLVAILGFQFIPPVVLCVPIFIMFARLGMLNSVFNLSLAYPAFTTPFAVWLLTGFFATIPPDLEEAAQIDGCSRLQAIYHIIIPIAIPGILAATLNTFIWVWQEFLLAVVMLTKPSQHTASIALSFFVGQMGIDWTGLMAAALIFSLPVLPVTYFARYFQQGLSMTGSKE